MEDGKCIYGNLKLPLYFVFVLHVVNTIESFINVFGCEKKICTGMVLCGFFIFEVTVLIYMQVLYFDSKMCIDYQPYSYYWLAL